MLCCSESVQTGKVTAEEGVGAVGGKRVSAEAGG